MTNHHHDYDYDYDYYQRFHYVAFAYHVVTEHSYFFCPCIATSYAFWMEL